MSRIERCLRGGAPALLLVLLPFAAGCGGAQPATATGRVVFQGKPLTFGTVTFARKDAKEAPVSATIQPDGTYSLAGLTAGAIQIAVNSPDPRVAVETKKGKELPPSTADRNLWFPIPAKYSMMNTAGLEYTVVAGPNAHDIELQ